MGRSVKNIIFPLEFGKRQKKKLAGLSTYAIPVLTLPPFSLRIPELQGTALYSGIQLRSYAPQGWAPTLLYLNEYSIVLCITCMEEIWIFLLHPP